MNRRTDQRAIWARGVLIAVMVLVAASFTRGAVAEAPPREPPRPEDEVLAATFGPPLQGELCIHSPESGPESDLVTTDSGYPDAFGYTEDDSVPFAWVDTSAGTDTGLDQYSTVAGPFPIGFPFRFYDNTYTQVWVSTYGLLGFNADIGYG